MTEDRKHQLDELSVTDILSYLGVRASDMEEQIRRGKKQGISSVMRKIINTVQNDNITDYRERLAIIKDIAFKYLEEVNK